MINDIKTESFCEKCIFILDNIKTIYETNELTDYMKTQDFNFQDQICKFCFGILSIDYQKDLTSQILEGVNKYEFSDFKLTTNFSPLFMVLHNYWKIKLKNNFKDSKEVNMIDVPLFRKTFKPLMIPKVTRLINKEHCNKSDFEVRCVFDFNEEYYSEVNVIITFRCTKP